MKNKKNVFIAVIGLLTISFIIAIYNGVFETIQSTEKVEGGYYVVGLEFTGAYSRAGEFMKKVGRKIGDEGISIEKGFGIYYDDPKRVKEENCRSFIGFILDKRDRGRIAYLKTDGFKVDSVPASQSIVAEFPIKNSFSYMIGPWKVYPVLSTYMAKNNYTADLTMEIYDIRNRKIFFLIQYH